MHEARHKRLSFATLLLRHIASLTEGVNQRGPLLLTDKLTTTLQLISTFTFPDAVAVCDSRLRVSDHRKDVNHCAPATRGTRGWRSGVGS